MAQHAGLSRMALALVLSGPLLAAPARVSAQQGRGEGGSAAVPGQYQPETYRDVETSPVQLGAVLCSRVQATSCK